MNALRIHISVADSLLRLTLAALLMQPLFSATAGEETFDVLQIGTSTYKNVTVTTKAKEYIFILHSAGMTNIKVAELSPELREQFGYGQKQKPQANAATVWATEKLTKLDLPVVKQLQQRWHVPLAAVTPGIVLAILVGFLLLYLFFCYCCKLICQKSGGKPGFLIWLPLLQLLPLLRAARMSRWWFLAWFIPGLNIVAQVLWSVKIVEARAMSGWVALFLLLPVTSLFAFLYLAFQEAAPEKEEPVVEIMTLDAA